MEQKRLDKVNLLVGIAAILLIALVGIFAIRQRKEINPTLGELAAEPTASPAETQSPAETAPATDPTRAPAKAFLVVTVGGSMYNPIPLYKEEQYTITRGNMVNVIEVTPDSVRMHSSSCENQDCVQQGVVSLENKDRRILQNMVICLPNQVTLELYTREEMAALLLSMAGYTGEEDHE